MDALELIEQNMDATKIIDHYNFEGVKQGGRFTRCACKIHGSDNDTSFVINNESGLWTCHTNCGSGSIYMLVQQLDECTFKEAVYKVAEILEINLDGITLDVNSIAYLKEAKRHVLTMRKNKKVEFESYVLPVETRGVKKYRQFEQDTLRHFGLRFISEIELESDKGGTYKLQNRIALPVAFKGNVVGYGLRKTREADFPKWSNQPKGLATRDILYNYDSLHEPDNVVLCEGFFDVWAFYEIGVKNAVSTFGAHLTDEQYKLLMKTGCTSVTIAFDGDRAGREATEKVIEKLRGKVDVYVIKFKEGQDSESIERSVLKEYYSKRIRRC